MLTAVKVKVKPLVFPLDSKLRTTTDADGLSSDQVPSNNTTFGSVGSLKKASKCYDEGNVPTIKWVTTTSLMDNVLTVFPAT